MAARRKGVRLLPLLAVVAVSLLMLALVKAGELLVIRKVLAAPEVIVSLGSHEWERLPASAALARQTPDSLVILTMPRVITPHSCDDCANRAARLQQMGVDPSRVRVLPLRQDTTWGEAIACRDFMRQAGLLRATIVTSPYHTRRALAVFRKVFDGTGVDLAVEPATATSAARPDRWWMTPYDRWYVAYEWTAIAYYTVRYGVFSIPTGSLAAARRSRHAISVSRLPAGSWYRA